MASYQVVSRIGRKLPNYMERIYISIECKRDDGRRVQYPTSGNGHTPYLYTWGYWARHYRSGLSKRDQASYDAAWIEAQAICDDLNGKELAIAA